MALASGALLALSFPRYGYPAAAWVALAPLLVAAVDLGRGGERRFMRRALALGFLTGVVYFVGTLYWLVQVMTTFGGLNTVSAIGAAAVLVIYLSIYPAIFAALVARLCAHSGLRALALAPAVWVATELGRTYVWSGFPWTLLGYSQATVLPIAQAASIVGVFGLSAIVCAVSAAIAYAAAIRSDGGPARVRRWLPLVASVAAVLVIAVWGALRMREGALLAAGEPVRVAVVQGNIEQEDKWDPALSGAILDRYLTMSRAALAARADLVIWPESATPFLLERDPRGELIRRMARQSGVPFLIGSDQIEPDPMRIYNAAFMVAPDGTTAGVYRKMHLVPFGEYVPLKRVLFFVGPLVEAVSDFSFGTEAVTLNAGGHPLSVAICYEVIYPSLIRGFVRSGSELLTTITNDAWYGRSSAAYQHWEQATLRAVEEGRYLARAANTGISGFVDPYGRALQRSDLFEQRMLVANLRFLRTRTVYNRIGDSAAWLCLIVTAAAVIFARKR